MTNAELLRQALRNQHNQLDQAVRDLSAEQLHWTPPGTKANHVGFTVWHYVRTEDNIIQFILQGRKPTLWISGGFYERFGLDRVAQGTGMTTEAANTLRLPAAAEWLEYQQAVWQATDGYLGSVKDAELESVITVKPLPEMPAWQAIATICLGHGHSHFGEICMLRVLQGLPSGLI